MPLWVLLVKKIGINQKVVRLKKLELIGFKSFAHKTTLEFPANISAIVGPNGSGKSNIVDAVRWVLGEQSLKNLRSKSGADLIWAGSTTKSSKGYASINLYFDNKDSFFPIDFEEVVIGRKVYRDGNNEYYLCDSQVRLKDIVELLARSKLGLRGHSIVNQGLADEILKSNPEERRSILEESLGLREFQLKKSETEIKLEETGANIIQTNILINEIYPHLRSLKRQVDKFRKRESLISDLNNFENQYFNIKIREISERTNNNQKEREALTLKITAAQANFESKEKIFEAKTTNFYQIGEKTKQIEDDLNKLNIERQNIMREFGRVEGLIESDKRRDNKNIKTVENVLAIKIKYWAKRLGAASQLHDASDIKEIIKTLASEIQVIGNYLEKKEIDKILTLVNLPDLEQIYKNPYEKDEEVLKIKLEQLENQIKQSQTAIYKIRLEENKWRSDYLASQKELELSRRDYILAQESAGKFDLEDEKIRLIKDDIKSEMWGAGKNYGEFTASFATEQTFNSVTLKLEPVIFTELINNITKLRREVADIGSIDEEIIREYEETNKRHEFLTVEVNDLSGAVDSLRGLIGDLNYRINNDFKNGITRINEEFNRYFRLMFLGGSAKLTVNNLDNQEVGVHINISIPQKRIKDLNLLSGGERSLVSIALLFAIVSASKPPFLILDEVDAALDEANAARFAKVLKDLAKDSQFVLITHNRSTMEVAKILYGVTMDSDGVSKLFSLKLEEAVS